MMACLGGTWDQPRTWVRFVEGVPSGDPIHGRVCDRQRMPYEQTRPDRCHGCPAYRGRNPDGSEVGVLNRDDSLNSLSEEEYERYVELVEEEQDPPAFYEWLLEGRSRGWPGTERDAEYQRRWRAAHPGYDKRKRDRAAYMRRYMREYRLRKRAERVDV